jgi:hypothetical protein
VYQQLIRPQEEDNPTIHLVAALLLYDGRHSGDDVVFEMMHKEGSFPRLVELVQLDDVQEETRLHQMLLELLYESSRVQRLDWEDFGMFGARLRTSWAIADTDISCSQRQLHPLSSWDH